MKFYGIHEGFYEGVQTRIDLLRTTCGSLGIEYVDIDSLTFDYSNIPKLTKNDLLYSLSSGSQTLVSLLLNNEVTTFYIKNPDLNLINATTEWSIIHEKAGIQAPKTIFHITSDRGQLKKYVEYLGGFPLIIKSVGSSRGLGTIKIDSWQNLISTIDYLMGTKDKFIMREFIKADYGARIMVLGDEVILSSKFLFQQDDFRNAPILSATRYAPLEISAKDANTCIQAVKLANLQMAGVDLLFDENGQAYLLEINFPTGFQSFKNNAQPVLIKMLNFLIAKANK